MLDVEFAQRSDPGRERENNEDYLGFAVHENGEEESSSGWLFALADGVGGQERGEVASRQAVECIVSGFRNASADEMYGALVPRLVQAANASVFALGNAGGLQRASMATTIVVCGLRYDSAVVSHVGDSRCYRIRQGIVDILTRDHTLANEQVRLGIVSAREAQASRTRQMLTRCLGQELIANIDTSEHRLFPGDVLMLCSDGLHGALSEAEISAAVADIPDLESAATELVARANEKDGSDNISVQLIRIREVERVGMYRGRPYRLR